MTAEQATTLKIKINFAQTEKYHSIYLPHDCFWAYAQKIGAKPEENQYKDPLTGLIIKQQPQSNVK